MAEPLKAFFSADLVRSIGESIVVVHPPFDLNSFCKQAVFGLESLELLDRGRHIMEAMRAHLPAAYDDALEILIRSLGPAHPPHNNQGDENLGVGMAPFFYLPHVDFIRTYGVESFERSIAAQETLTQRFTCEFSIRPFLETHPKRSLVVLQQWTQHESAHVRRLVSEGTRIRLPWASRIPVWEKDLDTIVQLLEQLKDDPSSMVRRSVANNLNDIAKVDPARVNAIAARWLVDATQERRAMVEHALRSLVKQGDSVTLELLGFGAVPKIELTSVRFEPEVVPIGGSVQITFDLKNHARSASSLLVDLAVHFVKSSGKSAPKVFKLRRVELGPGEVASFGKRVSLAVHTTRKPNRGAHRVEVLVNGQPTSLGHFLVTE